MTALDVEDVGHSFGRTVVLDGINFSIEPGMFVPLFGRNGAGKTTLFSLICRLYHARRGTIRVFDCDLRQRPTEALAHMGIVFQQPTLDLDLTVRENLRHHAALHDLPAAVARDRIAEELARLGLAHAVDRTVRTLSGGERRRAELARALLHRPRLMLLDEPTVGLDPETRQALLSHVRDLCRERSMAVLWATHLLDEARPDDPAIVIEQGRLVPPWFA